MKLKTAGALLLLGVMTLPSCKTSEENYRAAYEKTIQARRESGDSTEVNIYTNLRTQAPTHTEETEYGSYEVRTMVVRVTEGGGAIAEYVKEYCGVVGQFKQIFNAKSLRERLVDAGYPGAFIVETAEPYYYVVLTSGTINQVAQALSELKKDPNFVMREPCPFIIDRAPLKPQQPLMKRG